MILDALLVVLLADEEGDRVLVRGHVGDSAVDADTAEVQGILMRFRVSQKKKGSISARASSGILYRTH